MRRSSDAARTFAQRESQHLAREVDADHRRAAGARARWRSPDPPCPCTRPAHARPRAARAPRLPRSRQRAIDPRAEHVIEEVVSRRDRVEHAGDSGWGFIGRLGHRAQFLASCGSSREHGLGFRAENAEAAEQIALGFSSALRRAALRAASGVRSPDTSGTRFMSRLVSGIARRWGRQAALATPEAAKAWIFSG